VHQLRAAIMFIPQAKFQSMGSKMKYGLWFVLLIEMHCCCCFYYYFCASNNLLWWLYDDFLLLSNEKLYVTVENFQYIFTINFIKPETRMLLTSIAVSFLLCLNHSI
jgi:hypothetical protein